MTFQALESEIAAHEPLIAKVEHTAQEMVAKQHYAASHVQSRLDELDGELQQLKDMTEQRRRELNDSYNAQLVSLFPRTSSSF